MRGIAHKHTTQWALSLFLALTLLMTQTQAARAERARIVGGTIVVEGATPWQVIVLQNGGFHCGATLLSPIWVITAAHCVYGTDEKPLPAMDISVVIGEHDRTRPTDPNRQRRNVAAIVPHPQYSGVCCDFDLAMLQLESPVNITPAAQPILPLTTELTLTVGTAVFATGWGKTDKTGSTSTLLRQAAMTVSNNDSAYSYFLTTSSGDAVCFGDSGGPLTVDTPQGIRLAGVTSFGGCNPGGGFTRISDTHSWIADTLVTIEVSGPPSRRIYAPFVANTAG